MKEVVILWRRHQVLVRWLATVALAIYALTIATDVSNNQDEIEKSVRANCEVVSVLLSTRANRKQTVKLFESIRRENPVLFDKLIRRAQRGDRRLARAKKDLACETFATLKTPNGEQTPKSKNRDRKPQKGSNGSNSKKGEAGRELALHGPSQGDTPTRGGEPSNPPPGNSQPPPPPVDSGGGGGDAAPEPDIRIGPIELDLPDLPLIPDLPPISIP